jgi:alkylation response protein AidB-like acyl-CoA dehydrogenase
MQIHAMSSARPFASAINNEKTVTLDSVAERSWGKRSNTPEEHMLTMGSITRRYMLEYPVTWAYIDARMQRIYAGTDEIMKVIIAKQMGL